jgi:hypothetical protein
MKLTDEQGRLRDTGELRGQAERMLADPRARRFSESFAAQWLHLRKVGMFQPDKTLYPDYDRSLERSMVGETISFFHEVLERNDRIAVLIPQPRKHRHRHHGVCAPNHPLRRAVTALAVGNVGKQRPAANNAHAGHDAVDCCGTHAKLRSHDTSRIAWAKLMARVGEEFPLECPACGGDIRLARLRDFGDVWLAWGLWRMLGLDGLLAKLLPEGREDGSWGMVAAILAIARFCEPSSELHIEETWYRCTTLEDLLGVPPEKVHTDRRGGPDRVEQAAFGDPGAGHSIRRRVSHAR